MARAGLPWLPLVLLLVPVVAPGPSEEVPPRARLPVPDPFEELDRPAGYALKLPHRWRTHGVGLHPGMDLAHFWDEMGATYRYVPADNPLVACARTLGNPGAPDCMRELVLRRYQLYWVHADPEEYDKCCQPSKAERCIEPPWVDGLPVCGFPYGSVDHLPAFLPELRLRLPGGLNVRVLQGIGDEDLDCGDLGCRLRPFHFQEIEARLLWSTSMAATLAAAEGLVGRKAIDLGSGVGLTCVVMAKKGARVTCSDINEMSLRTMGRNADANGVNMDYGYFNYTSPSASWPPWVRPPYDVIVSGATPQDELRIRLPAFARLFRALGAPGARVFVEDQGHATAARWGLAADDESLWASHGLQLEDIFDPSLDRGYWPMPHGRIYVLRVL